jgi:sigma-B regulation protein RsbU (phosphoserine phosphatase)
MKEGAEDVLLRNEIEPGFLAKSVRYAIKSGRRKACISRLLFALERISASVIIATANGEIEFVDDRFSRMTGYKRRAHIGNGGSAPEGPHAGKFIKKLRECMDTGSSWSGEVRDSRENGELTWERISISPLKNLEGAITHYVAINQDLTEYKKAQDALIKSEERFRTVINNVNEYIYSVAYEGEAAVST